MESGKCMGTITLHAACLMMNAQYVHACQRARRQNCLHESHKMQTHATFLFSIQPHNIYYILK